MILYEGKKYFTPREAERMLSIHLATVYSWCRKQQVELLDLIKIEEEVASKYLIEEESLRRRHKRVHLETQ